MKTKLPVFFILPVFAFLLLVTGFSESPTFDETHYLGKGVYLLKNKTWDIPSVLFHPPLFFYTSGLPLLLFNIPDALWKTGYNLDQHNIPLEMTVSIQMGRYLMEMLPKDLVLLLSRFPIMLLGILLGYCLFRFTDKIYGRHAAYIALILYCFCPNMIAHSTLVTPDLVLSLFYFLSLVSFFLAVENPSLSRVLMAGGALGLALASKYSALLLGPVFLIPLPFVVIQRKLSISKLAGMVLGIWITGFFVLWGCYFFETTSFEKLQKSIAGIQNLRQERSWLIEKILKVESLKIKQMQVPLPSFIKGAFFQYAYSKNGFNNFMLGHYSKEGWWSYFAVAFFFKTTIAALMLLLLSLIFCRNKNLFDYFLWTGIGVFFLYFSFFNKIDIGVRYILPVYPLIYVLISRLALEVESRSSRFKWLVVTLIFFHVLESLFQSPNSLSFFNAFSGGAKNKGKIFADSNLDWGQDLKNLKVYMEKKKIPQIKLRYFGSVDPSYYGINYVNLEETPAPGLIAISAALLMNVSSEDKTRFQWLRNQSPMDVIGGGSILVYDIKAENGNSGG